MADAQKQYRNFAVVNLSNQAVVANAVPPLTTTISCQTFSLSARI